MAQTLMNETEQLSTILQMFRDANIRWVYGSADTFNCGEFLIAAVRSPRKEDFIEAINEFIAKDKIA